MLLIYEKVKLVFENRKLHGAAEKSVSPLKISTGSISTRTARPPRSEALRAKAGSLAIDVARNGAKILQFRGFRQGKLVAASRHAL